MAADAMEVAVALVRQAGERLKRFARQAHLATDFKTDRTVVTEADRAADRLVTQGLLTAFPQDGVLSEEHRPAWQTPPARLWVLDPLDGTTNFRLGIPVWGVSLARLVNGVPDLAVLYFPLLDELYLAQRGAGATLNGRPLHVNPQGIQGQMAFFTCCSRTHRRYRVSLPYKTRILGSAAYHLLTVARGSAVLAFEATPKVWDIAAAWLVVAEAGGVIETFHGPAPFPLAWQPGQSFPVLAAASPALAQFARQHIHPRPPASE